MPGGDGSGPRVGPGGGGRGRMSGGGTGGPNYCRCPGCGYRAQHARGKPCNSINCPKCGVKLTRG